MFSPTRPRPALLCLALSSLVFSGCGPKTGGPSSSSSGAPASNIFRVAIVGPPTTFDPATVQDGTTIDLLQQMYEGLVQWTTDNKVAGALAEKWDVSKDGKTYTFHLRSGAKFQDGSPVTAQDVYNSLHRALDPALKSPVALTYLGDIAGAKELSEGKSQELTGVKVVDPQTVAITIQKPKAYWIYTLTYPTGYVLSPAVNKNPTLLTDTDAAKGIGTGPFKLTAYTKDFKVALDANPTYWDGAPKIAGIERPIVVDANTRHDLYTRGQLDVLQYETQGDLENDEKNAGFKSQVKFFPRASTFYIGLNQAKLPELKNLQVRQALAYATDKKKIVDVALRGQVKMAEDILPEGIPGFDPNFKGLPYDPEKARTLLAAAGFAGGKNFPVVEMTYRESYPDLAKTVDLIRQMWQDNLGITVKSSSSEYGVMLNRLNQNTVIPCFHIRWAADYLDPQDYYSVLLRTGAPEDHTGYSNPKFDALCDAADVSQDVKARDALYRQAARIAADEVPMIPLYYQRDIELVKPYVSGIDDSLMGHLPYKNIVLAK